MIAASDGAGRGTSRTDSRGGADKSAGGSPFSILLAATSQPTSPQSAPSQNVPAPPAANDDVALTAKDADTRTEIASAAAQPVADAPGDGTVAVDGSRHDKKADGGKDPDGGTVATAQQSQAAAQIPFDPTVVPFVPPSVLQTPSVAEGDDGADGANSDSPSIAAIPQNNGGPVTQAPSADKNPAAGNQPVGEAPADPQTSSQPRPADAGAEPAPQSPAPIQVSAGDTGDATDKVNDDPLNGALNSKGDGPAAQNGINAPLPKNPIDQSAANTGEDAATLARMTNAVQAPAARPGAGDTIQADKPVRAASDIATGGQPGTAPVDPATAMGVGGKSQFPGDTSQESASSDNADGKPARVSPSDAMPQPDMPLPVAHAATPANGPPQGLIAIDTAGTNLPDNAANAMVTASVHVAATGVAPDTDALAVTIAARSLSGAKQFEIRLDPPELGRVEVRLSIDASGKTQAHMTADQPQTLDLLRKDAPALTQALREAGLDVSQSGLNFSLRGQDRQADDRNNSAGQGRRTNLTATRAIQAAQGTAAISFNGAAADARVDIHV